MTFLSLDGPPHAGKFAEIPTKVIKDKITAVKYLITNTFPHLRRSIEKTIVNKTLRASLLKHMEEGHRSSMLHELEDYYHLTPNHVPLFYASMEPAELFARHALEYLQNHPHKPNWPLRHILKTEGIDPALKEEIRDVFNKGVVPPNRVNHILQVLQTVYLQYQHILKESEADGTVQATVAIYQYLADELETFTTTHKRLPEFRFEHTFMRLIALRKHFPKYADCILYWSDSLPRFMMKPEL